MNLPYMKSRAIYHCVKVSSRLYTGDDRGGIALPFQVNDIHMLRTDIILDIKGIFDNYSKLHIQIRDTISQR